MKKWVTVTTLSVLLATTVASGALAFNDLADVPHSEKIMELRDRGIVQGVGNSKFAPHEKMSAQQAIPLIVKSLELSLAHMTFIKQPIASDVFTKIPDDAWYAEAFVIAHANGVPIDPDINPNEQVTREQFVHWLMNALYATGDYAFIELYMMFEDEKNVSEGFMTSIQRALVSNIAELDEDKTFRPQVPITRAEAAVFVRNAMDFAERQKVPVVQDPIKSGEIEVIEQLITEDVAKITLSMGEKPHPGWGVKIESIVFQGDNTAVIRYSMTYPDPAALYPQVIAYPKAETYLGAKIENIKYELVGVYDKIPDPDQPVSDANEGNASSAFEGSGAAVE